jgi:hypothetical protein
MEFLLPGTLNCPRLPRSSSYVLQYWKATPRCDDLRADVSGRGPQRMEINLLQSGDAHPLRTGKPTVLLRCNSNSSLIVCTQIKDGVGARVQMRPGPTWPRTISKAPKAEIGTTIERKGRFNRTRIFRPREAGTRKTSPLFANRGISLRISAPCRAKRIRRSCGEMSFRYAVVSSRRLRRCPGFAAAPSSSLANRQGGLNDDRDRA